MKMREKDGPEGTIRGAALSKGIEATCRRIGRVGGKASIFCRVEGEAQLDCQSTESEVFPAASLNQLAIVQFLIAQGYRGDEMIRLPPRKEDHKGPGYFDRHDEQEATIGAIVQDMTKSSGHRATFAIRLRVDEINAFLRDEGFEQTWLDPRDDDSFSFGQTTAEEAVRMLDLIRSSEGELAATARQGLIESPRRLVGMRLPGSLDECGSKIGALNKDQDHGYLRHDVGWMGHAGKLVVYGVLTETRWPYTEVMVKGELAKLGVLMARCLSPVGEQQ